MLRLTRNSVAVKRKLYRGARHIHRKILIKHERDANKAPSEIKIICYADDSVIVVKNDDIIVNKRKTRYYLYRQRCNQI